MYSPNSMFIFGIYVCLLVGGAHADNYVIPLFGLNTTGDANNTEFTLIVISDVDTTLSISGSVTNTTIPSKTVTINRQARNVISLSGLPFLNSTGIKNDSLLVSAYNNITMQVITSYAGYYEGFMAIPTTSLGNEYYADTFCALGGYCQVTIATTVSGTTKVYLRLPSNVDGEIMYCQPSSYWKSGRDTVIELEYPDTLQITSPRDLTGSHIYTDNPVSVLVGALSIPNGNHLYHYIEQFIPTREWGKEFIFKTFGNGSYGDVIGIIALNDGTVVTMEGFKDTNMAEGQSIKRHMGPNLIVHVTSNHPIQVTLFTGFDLTTNNSTASTLTMNNPGMSLVPALEHTEAASQVTCLNTGNSVATVQFSTQVSLSFSNFITESTDRLPYSQYDVYHLQPTTSVKDSPYYLVDSEGMVVCEGTAIMPMVQMTLQTNSTCVPDNDSMYPGDGLDNDCDGYIDEAYCFENKMVNDSLFFTTGGTNEPHSEDISGFRFIKLRIASLCQISNIELRDVNNGTVFIQITGQAINAYSLFHNETLQHIHQNLTMYALQCDRIYPFWLLRTPYDVCFDIGPTPPTDCVSTSVKFLTGTLITNMRIGSSYTNVTYWIDLQRFDCGKLHSTWRCGNLMSNCSDYGPDVCTNYVTWSQVYCGVYCGFCIPDSFGQLFALTLPPTTDASCVKTISMFPKTPQNSTSPPLIGIGLTSSVDMTNPLTFTNESMYMHSGSAFDYNAIEFTGSAVDNSNIFIYADVDIRVTVDYNCGNGPDLIYAVEPVDTSGVEYMTSFFQTSITCHIIAHDVKAVVQKVRSNSVTDIGTVYPNTISTVELTDAETTGTILSSNNPVTVFCGNVGSEYTWQQLLPTTTWGIRYVIPATYDSTVTRITARIVTNRDFTVVFLNGDFDVDFTLTNRGDYVDQELQPNVVYVVTSNRPVSVGVLYQTSSYDLTDSSWIVLRPTDNFSNQSELFVPLSGTEYTSVIISFVDDVGNGTDESYVVDPSETRSVFYVAQAQDGFMLATTSDGQCHALKYLPSTSTFMDLSQAFQCTIPGSNTVGDGLDNDCDGLIDEETVCYTGYDADQLDTDMDGAFGEDCLSEATGTPVVSPPDPPLCYINTTKPGCWRVCASCLCSWVINLEAYNQLTKEQQMLYNLNITTGIVTNLTVDKETLSSEIAKDESATDERQTSKNIGYVGYLILAASLSMFVIFDVLNLVAHIRRTCLASK